jgi:hypothetical protein
VSNKRKKENKERKEKNRKDKRRKENRVENKAFIFLTVVGTVVNHCEMLSKDGTWFGRQDRTVCFEKN